MEQHDPLSPIADRSADRAPVLVLVPASEHEHPTLRALRWQSEHTATPLVEVDVADVDHVDADGMCAVVAIGAPSSRAARYAIDHDLIHLEVDDYQSGGRLDATLDRHPDQWPVIAADIDDRSVGYAITRVHVESPGRFDVVVDGHRWSEVTGPITVETSSRHASAAWVTVRDGPAVLLAASPPLSSAITITPDDTTTVVIDDDWHHIAATQTIVLTLPLRYRTARIGP